MAQHSADAAELRGQGGCLGGSASGAQFGEDLPEQPTRFPRRPDCDPERIIWPGHPKRPEKLDVDNLSPDQITAIPVLGPTATPLTGGAPCPPKWPPLPVQRVPLRPLTSPPLL